ncbi:hypothetical protein [Vibrio harveyi]|uniref:hypothetical protein n=1 Tax=Vibrio harveyi TaxID=669 RepID=UPI0024B82F44|nr:hypothetical protein [Vibrio harveyi]WHP63909.1 hypothetical protein QMY49_05035 [Vibrio harveyi]
MSIDLDKKQIFSTISDMVVYSPKDAKDIFEIITSRGMSSDFSDIFPVIDFVNENYVIHPDREYYLKLRECISNITNDEIRIIFNHALNNIDS